MICYCLGGTEDLYILTGSVYKEKVSVLDNDTEYELLPHEQLESLRREIAQLKKSSLRTLPREDDLTSAIDRLTSTMNKLITILANANDEMIDQFSQTTFVQQFNKLTQQQEQLAEGMVQISRMVQQLDQQKQQPFVPSQPAPSSPPPSSSSIQNPLFTQSPSSPPQQSFFNSQQPVGYSQQPVLDSSFSLQDTSSFEQASQLQGGTPNTVNTKLPPPPVDLPPPPEHKKGLFRFGK